MSALWVFSSVGILSEGKGECVKDLPAMEGSLQDWKPGLYYGVDDQCRIAFGSTAKACSFTNNDLVCHSLHGTGWEIDITTFSVC